MSIILPFFLWIRIIKKTAKPPQSIDQGGFVFKLIEPRKLKYFRLLTLPYFTNDFAFATAAANPERSFPPAVA